LKLSSSLSKADKHLEMLLPEFRRLAITSGCEAKKSHILLLIAMVWCVDGDEEVERDRVSLTLRMQGMKMLYGFFLRFFFAT